MEAQRLTQSRHCSPGPGHQSQNGGVAASSLSLPALSAPAPGLSDLLNNQHYTDTEGTAKTLLVSRKCSDLTDNSVVKVFFQPTPISINGEDKILQNNSKYKYIAVQFNSTTKYSQYWQLSVDCEKSQMKRSEQAFEGFTFEVCE